MRLLVILLTVFTALTSTGKEYLPASAGLTSTQAEGVGELVPAGKGYSSTSVNATIFRKNSIVSKDGWQFVAYYDAEGYVTIGKRHLGEKVFSVTRSPYKGNVADAHNVICIGIDGKGFLHVAFDHHNNRLHYCRSIAPFSTTLGEETSMVGGDEDKVSYPEFYTLSSGNLLFAYRSGRSGQGDLVMNRYDTEKGEWHRMQDILIDGEGKRNAYWQLTVDRNGLIHMAWVWRETWFVETNHDLCYAYSDDEGKTWKRSDGATYALPITQDNAEYIAQIPQNSELINQTSIAADELSRPYIATYWKAPTDSAPQFKVVYKGSNGWNICNVGQRTMDFSLSGGGTKMIPISRPQIAVRCGKKKKKEVDVYVVYRDAETGSRVTVARSKDFLKNNSQWDITTPYDMVVDAWEPSYDTNLWNTSGRLHLYVQRVSQGDGEKTIETAPQDVYVMEIDLR